MWHPSDGLLAHRVTGEPIQPHDGYGFTDEFPVSRFYRVARCGTLGGGTTEALRHLIGKRVLVTSTRSTASSASACSEAGAGSCSLRSGRIFIPAPKSTGSRR